MVLGDHLGPIHAYTTKLGQSLLTKRTTLVKSIHAKWHGDLVAGYQPKWSDVWHKSRPQKDARFLWLVYHCVVAIHSWRKVANPNISTICSSCQTGLEETILHCFHHCDKIRHAWNFGLFVLYAPLQILAVTGLWPSLTWQQCILGSKLPRRLKHGTPMWSLFRGSMIWTIWLDHNAIYFNNNPWPTQKLKQVLWEAFVDHAQVAWFKTKKLCELYSDKEGSFLKRFDNIWLLSDFLGVRSHLKMSWKLAHPKMGAFNWLSIVWWAGFSAPTSYCLLQLCLGVGLRCLGSLLGSLGVFC